MNLGPAGSVQKMHYDVTLPTDPVSPNVLRAQSLVDPATGFPDLGGVQPRNPIAGNIALLKVQYGVTNGVGTGAFLDTWVKGVAPWDPATISAATGPGPPEARECLPRKSRESRPCVSA